MRFRSASRVFLLTIGVAACGLVTASCEKSKAQGTAPGRACHAKVSSSGLTSQCPTSTLKFHVSVEDCSVSSGTYEYDYLLVMEGRKPTVHGTGTWNTTTSESDQSQTVTTACGSLAADVDPVKVTSCTCSD